jgi:hypothetical protein
MQGEQRLSFEGYRLDVQNEQLWQDNQLLIIELTICLYK